MASATHLYILLDIPFILMKLITQERLAEKFNLLGLIPSIEENEDNLFIIDGVTLEYGQYNALVRGQIVERDGWIVGYSQRIPGSRWEPEDEEIITDSYYSSLNHAIGRIVALFAIQKLDNEDERTMPESFN